MNLVERVNEALVREPALPIGASLVFNTGCMPAVVNLNLALSRMSPDEQIEFMLDFNSLWHQSRIHEPDGDVRLKAVKELNCLIGEELHPWFGDRLITVRSAEGTETSAWYGMPSVVCAGPVDLPSSPQCLYVMTGDCDALSRALKRIYC